jgi:hypothetical protein
MARLLVLLREALLERAKIGCAVVLAEETFDLSAWHPSWRPFEILTRESQEMFHPTQPILEAFDVFCAASWVS